VARLVLLTIVTFAASLHAGRIGTGNGASSPKGARLFTFINIFERRQVEELQVV
jgi:hypothetical protein